MKIKLFIYSLLLILLLSIGCLSIGTTIDPVDIGVGTRALGMGKAFIAVADDSNSVFYNPAGLSYVRDWGGSSMYTTLLTDISFTTFSLHRSITNEGFGIGFVSANVGGDVYTGQIDPVSHRIIPFTTTAVGYSSNVFIMSYGLLLGKYFTIPYVPELEKASAGLNVKFFTQTLKSSEESAASGYNMDFGLIYPVNKWCKAAYFAQNVLPGSLGGLLRWNAGDEGNLEETIPSTYKMGVSAKVLGSDAYMEYPNDVYLNFDNEWSSIATRPSAYHLGFEWWLYKYLALRLGLDQEIYSKSDAYDIDNNMTFGLGFWSGDWGFDYAYHQYGPFVGNTTHYFTLSYGYPWAKEEQKPAPAVKKPEQPIVFKKQEPEEPSDFVAIYEPSDKLVTFSDRLIVNGEIIREGVDKVLVNGVEPVVLKEGSRGTGPFSVSITVPQVGKFPITISVYDAKGALLKDYKLRVKRLLSFSDVKAGYWAKDMVIDIATLGYIGGFPDGTFRPGSPINRAEMTAMLIRALDAELPSITADPFKDVSKKSWAARYIKVGVDRGLITGYRDQTFKPGGTITRAEGVVMMAKFAGLVPPKILNTKPFPDVPASHWAAKWIQAAKQEGLLTYLSGKSFEPNKTLTRADAMEMLSKTKLVSQKIDDLRDWGNGF